MKDIDGLNGIEKRIGAAIAVECESVEMPPFAGILSRIAASGQDEEPDILPELSEKQTVKRQGRFPLAAIIGMSAAAAFVFIAGGLLLGVMMNRDFSDAKSEAAVEYYDAYEACEETNEAADDCDSVSDSDLSDSSGESSGAQSE